MTTYLCFIAWMTAMLSDRNQSTTVTVLCFAAYMGSLIWS